MVWCDVTATGHCAAASAAIAEIAAGVPAPCRALMEFNSLAHLAGLPVCGIDYALDVYNIAHAVQSGRAAGSDP